MLFVTILLCTIPIISASNILMVFPTTSKSHSILGEELGKGLARRGHNVTMVGAYPQNKPYPNYHDIYLKTMFMDLKVKMVQIMGFESSFELKNVKFSHMVQLMRTIGNWATDITFNEPEFQEVLKQNFDVVIIESFLNDALFALGDHFSVPVIAFSPVGPCFWNKGLVGNAAPYSVAPNLFSSYSDSMDFWERLTNTGISLLADIYWNWMVLPRQEDLRAKYLPHTRPLSEVRKDVSLVFLNSDRSFNYPQSIPPNMVEIGGFHVLSPKPLPDDLQKVIDDATHGVVYFSMGSNLMAQDMAIERVQEFLKVFAKLNQTVLWKWEDENLPGKPKNVLIGKWFPQSDILAHPNVKLFITHGGLLSTIEAISRAVPIIGIPIFADQYLNMEKATKQGYGLQVNFDTFTEPELTATIHTVLNNDKYRNNMKRLSGIFHDQLVPPMDRAIYWVEHVIKHKGAPHLRSSAREMNVFQYYLVDVITTILLVVFFVLFLTVKVFKMRFSRRKDESKKISMKKKNM